MRTKSLCIAIFGNTNNYPLMLAKGLRQLGHTVRLILNRKDLLHRPSALYPEWETSPPEWIKDCSDVTEEDFAFETPKIDTPLHSLTHNVDLAILNDTGPALSRRLKVPHIALLTGSDLAYQANFDSIPLRTAVWHSGFKRSGAGQRYTAQFSDFVIRQREGILSADVVCYGQRGLVPSGDKLLDDIGVDDSQRLMLHFSNVYDLQKQPMPKNDRLTVLCGTRAVFRQDGNESLSALDFKGTDKLIKGFASYVAAGGRGILKLPRKGADVAACMRLIKDLGISNSVKWYDEVPLRKFYELISTADLVCDQFGSSFPGLVTTDAYALGRAVMANFRNEVLSERFAEEFPGLNASSELEIGENLRSIEQNPQILKKLGAESREYAEKYLAPDVMAGELLKKWEAARQ